jgi:hypothetical protein
MIRYYAYYSCGGYKDLYLGDSSLKTDYTYFLPLLATWQKGIKPEYAEKLRQVEGLQQIGVISNDNHFDFPTQAKNLFSHGGYRVIYLTLLNGDTCLCIRDITNGAKDEENRNIPFNILITASGEEDTAILDKFCLSYLGNIDGLYELMSPIFSYDPLVNGIKFNLGKLENAIYDTPTSDKGLRHLPNHVNFLIADTVSMASVAMSELKLKKEQIDYIAFNDGRTFGRLAYKDQTDSEGLSNTLSQPTKSDDALSNNPEQNITKEEAQTNLETTIDEPAQAPKQERTDKNLNAIESPRVIQSDKADDLINQLSNTLKVLNDLSDSITNICVRLDEQKSTASLDVRAILDKIETLKARCSTSLPSISTSGKDDTYICIQKIHLWLAGGAFIVGFLLGALIF